MPTELADGLELRDALLLKLLINQKQRRAPKVVPPFQVYLTPMPSFQRETWIRPTYAASTLYAIEGIRQCKDMQSLLLILTTYNDECL
jgi:hypothetical protein